MRDLLLILFAFVLTLTIGMVLIRNVDFSEKTISEETLDMLDTFSVKLDIDTEFLENFKDLPNE